MRDRRAVDVICGGRSPRWLGRGCKRRRDGSADKCASIHRRILLLLIGKGTGIREKRSAALRKAPHFVSEHTLEQKLQAELQGSLAVSARRMQEITRGKVVVHAVPLSVVEEVESLRTKLKRS